MKLKERKISIF
jgi:hypothetical protein